MPMEIGGGYETSGHDSDYCKQRVIKKYKTAFIRRTLPEKDGMYVYQVCRRRWLLWIIPLGDTHYFQEQAWRSAHYKIFGN